GVRPGRGGGAALEPGVPAPPGVQAGVRSALAPADAAARGNEPRDRRVGEDPRCPGGGAMSRYAENTSVPSERSRGEIERTLIRYGADQFAYGWETGKATIGFRAANRYVRFELPMPHVAEFELTPTGRYRSATQVSAA